jgi:hypothetical protein
MAAMVEVAAGVVTTAVARLSLIVDPHVKRPVAVCALAVAAYPTSVRPFDPPLPVAPRIVTSLELRVAVVVPYL